MRKTNTLKQLSILVLFLMSFSMAWAGGSTGGGSSTYYAKAAAHAKGATGAGLVYANKDNSRPADSAFGTDITSGSQSNTGSSASSWNFYLWAQPQGDGIFKGWYNNEACTGTPISTSTSYTTDKITGQENENYTKDFYALFVYHYFATVNAAVVGEGGEVSVNSGEAGATASATLVSGDMTGESTTLSFSLSAQATDNDHFFVGWYSDAECTNQISDQPACNVSINTNATNAGAAVAENYYAKFEEIVRNDYTFTLVANPAHITILGGEEGSLVDIDYSAEGMPTTTDIAPLYTFSVAPVGNVIYSVNLYNGNELVATYANEATGATTFAIANTTLADARLVVESRQGWFLTAKANPEVITSLTLNGQPLAYSAEGTRNELTVEGDCVIAYTTSSNEVLSTLRFYNAANEMIYMPLQNEYGAQTATIDAASVKDGKVDVEGLVLGDLPHFTIKADPALIESITAEVTSSYSTPTSWSKTLNFSPEGSINVYPSEMDMVNDYLHLHVVPKNSNVAYTVAKTYTKGTPWNNSFTGTVCNTYLHYTSSIEINEALVEIEGYELLDEPWSFTVIADPDLVKVRDYANGNATVECSLDGVVYSPSGQQSQLQIQAKDANCINKIYNAYFFPAGADITDYDSAYMFKEGINVKNTTSWLATLDKKIPNTYANGGTLVIKNLEGVGTGNVTINISGTASNVVVTNGGNEVKGLKVGENTVPLTAAILSFTHKTNGSYLASVTCNGKAIKPANSEGKFSYTNKFATDGDVYDIVTDYANTEYDVYIDVTEGCEAFVTEVTVDDKAVTWTAGQPVKVAEGKTIRVQGDKLNYIVNAVTINDEPQIVNNSASTQVLADTRISFDVTYINRDKSLTFEIGSNAKGDYKTALNSYEEVTKTKTIAFCDMDNPIDFGGSCTSSAEKEWVGRWYVNGEFKATGISFVYSAIDGDRIKVEFVDGDKIETTYNVTFSRSEGLEAWPDVTVDGEAKTPGSMALTAGQEIVIKSNEYVNVTGVKVNNVRQTPNDDGEYVITVVDEDLRIEIIGEAVAEAPTFTLNITGDADMLYVADAENEFIEDLQEGENVIDMTTIAEGPISISNPYYAPDYYVSAISLNGVSILNDENYYINYLNGTYQIDVQADDVIDVTISQFTRNNVLHVYIDGYEASRGCSISDKYNSVGSLVEKEDGTLGGELQEGLNVVRFADIDLPLNFQMMGLIDASTKFSIKLGNEDVEYTDGTGYLIDCTDGQDLYVIFSEGSTETVFIDESHKATFSSHNDIYIEPDNNAPIKAYIAVGFNFETQQVVFERVKGIIPAGTGLLIVSSERVPQEIPVYSAPARAFAMYSDGEEDEEGQEVSTASFENNLLVPAYKYSTIPAADENFDCYQYCEEGEFVGFFPVTEPVTARANMAYLMLPKDDNRDEELPIIAGIPNHDGTTGVSDITVENASTDVYNMLGVKVANSINEKSLKSGMYIVNGKKVVIR